ncbi:MAG: cupin domain-containing protein [Pseudomonadota bacterium]
MGSENPQKDVARALTAIPALASASLAAADVAWEETGTPGFDIKRLLEDEVSGWHTWLMRVAPGVAAQPHAHERTEQIYVLEGTFYDDDGEYAPGDFIVRSPGAIHTGGSRDGAVVLLIYT